MPTRQNNLSSVISNQQAPANAPRVTQVSVAIEIVTALWQSRHRPYVLVAFSGPSFTQHSTANTRRS
jgi:hypothetical protein